MPALELIGGVRNSLDQGLLALGRLDGAAGTLPDAHLLLYTYVRTEAVLSSQIGYPVNRIHDPDGDACTGRITEAGDRA
ncbi:MAG: Fic/DOC family N-terminal domain-containing protein [Gammaproteobacteria bacterium]